MPKVEVRGYLDVPDEDWSEALDLPSRDGLLEIRLLKINDLDGLQIRKVADDR